ncbi:MAG TPA: YkgJ family cysteine cluster protein, partial [bacterium]|nr:YkgJ family cysteine cluster protein [bacterium]
MGKCEADKCNAKCCRYTALVIDTPRSRKDFDDIRWFVCHEDVSVYKDQEDNWVLEFVSLCKNLKNNRCMIYDKRPDICRDYNPDKCTADSKDQDAKILFKEPSDVEKFTAARW